MEDKFRYIRGKCCRPSVVVVGSAIDNVLLCFSHFTGADGYVCFVDKIESVNFVKYLIVVATATHRTLYGPNNIYAIYKF